jgi:AbrB family looped-hinge helix DNA binding protein
MDGSGPWHLGIRGGGRTASGGSPYAGKACDGAAAVDALLTLSSKGQLVIPARLRQLLGLQPGDRLELTLEADGLRLRPHGPAWCWSWNGCCAVPTGWSARR